MATLRLILKEQFFPCNQIYLFDKGQYRPETEQAIFDILLCILNILVDNLKSRASIVTWVAYINKFKG